METVHLEVIQKAHVGVAERNLPPSICLCDFWFEGPTTHRIEDLTCERPVEQLAEQRPERRIVQLCHELNKRSNHDTLYL